MTSPQTHTPWRLGKPGKILDAHGNVVLWFDCTTKETLETIVTAVNTYDANQALIRQLVEALDGAVGSLEFSRDYHTDLGNEEQAYCQDRLDAALAALSAAKEAGIKS